MREATARLLGASLRGRPSIRLSQVSKMTTKPIRMSNDENTSQNDLKSLKTRARKIIQLLKRAYPDAKCSLNHSNAFELLIATILSAQCTDERVNIVTADLFRKYRKPQDYLKVSASELQDDIRTAYVPKYYHHLTVSVKTDERVYFVGGEVRIPNRQFYQEGITVLRALDTAGGFTDFANRKNIELRRENGEIIKIDWKKAMRNPKLDPVVYPNDQIIVHKRII